MSSILSTNKNFLTWIYLGEYNLKNSYSGEEVYKFIIGSCDDESGIYDIKLYIRKSIYDKLKSNEYIVDKNKSQCGNLVITDNKGILIKPLSEGYCY